MNFSGSVLRLPARGFVELLAGDDGIDRIAMGKGGWESVSVGTE